MRHPRPMVTAVVHLVSDRRGARDGVDDAVDVEEPDWNGHRQASISSIIAVRQTTKLVTPGSMA